MINRDRDDGIQIALKKVKKIPKTGCFYEK